MGPRLRRFCIIVMTDRQQTTRKAPAVNTSIPLGNGVAARSARVSLLDRALARVIDLTLVSVPAAVAIALMGPTGVLVGLLVLYLYEALSVAVTGTTVGKRLRHLRVVDVDTGGRPVPAKAGTRILLVVALAAVVQLFAPYGPMVAVFVWGSAVASADRRGLVDRAANTAVVAV